MKNWQAKKIAATVLGAAAVIGGIVALTIALWPESSATAKKNFCTSLSNLSSTVLSYEGLDPLTATNAQRDQAYDDITSAWNDVVDDADDWANAYDNPLANAYDDLYWAAQALPDDNTLAEDLNDLQPELAAFPQAFHDTFDGSGCASV
jgi:hypothetical protein